MSLEDQNVNSAILLAAQVRAARAILGLTARELAQRTDLSLNTIRKAEIEERISSLTAANLRAIRQALESAGVVFVTMPAFGPGVCIRQS